MVFLKIRLEGIVALVEVCINERKEIKHEIDEEKYEWIRGF